MLILCVIGVLAAQLAAATQPTVGTLSGYHEGYTLFTPLTSAYVYLINAEGRIINEWRTSGAGRDVFLKENGNIVATVPLSQPDDTFAADVSFAQRDGRFEEYTWDGERVWSYELDRPGSRIHHGITLLNNGHIMFIAWDYKSREEAIANGRDPAQLGDGLWSEAFIELDPKTDEIVWEWHVWDHLVQDFDPTKANYGVVADNPQLIDINYYANYELIEDWIHANSIGYNPQLNQVAFSAREQNEIWVVDRNTTTEEARTTAGDLLYRWGNPAAYDQVGTTQLYYQHDIMWIPQGYPGAGNMIAFSNRHPVEGDDELLFSRIVEWTPPVLPDGSYDLSASGRYGPDQPTWTWDQQEIPYSFISYYLAGAERLINGNTLITDGMSGRLIEVRQDGSIAWAYQLPQEQAQSILLPQGSKPDARIFRARRYEPDFAAFQGRDLTPGPRLEDLAGRVG